VIPDIIFENAQVVDGSGQPAFAAEVAIGTGRILAVEPRFPESFKAGAERVDLGGSVIAPGFIDVHAHGELEPLADNSAAGKATQGVTTEISGNCGHAPFPLLGALRERFEKEAAAEFGWEAGSLDWTSAGEYLAKLERTRCALNRGFLAGHNCLRAAVNGYAANPVGPAGLRRMEELLRECLEAGCFGLSTGLCYPPGCFAPFEEIRALGAICAKAGALYTSHMRSESDALEEALDEIMRLCRETGVRAQISHLKTSAPRNWGKIGMLEEKLFAARREGLDFHADRYPYIASSTGLDAVLPRWAYAGGNEEELKRLKDPAVCAKLEAEIVEKNPAPEYWSRIQIAGAVTPHLRAEIPGRTLAEIAAAWGLRPFEALRRILLEDELRTSAVFFIMCEENLAKILSWDFVMIGSDATARNLAGPTRAAAPHPRTFGAFPRVLARYVRERKLLTLEEAVRRMTSLPAQAFNLKDRGVIRSGAHADLVAFNPQTVRDEATYAAPNRFASGIERVYVNGVLVAHNGKICEARPGMVLRRGE
jgi:N-acyl-D-amino-acid deacylase